MKFLWEILDIQNIQEATYMYILIWDLEREKMRIATTVHQYLYSELSRQALSYEACMCCLSLLTNVKAFCCWHKCKYYMINKCIIIHTYTCLHNKTP